MNKAMMAVFAIVGMVAIAPCAIAQNNTRNIVIVLPHSCVMAWLVPPHRRGVSRSSRRAGRDAVAAFGGPDVHPSRRPKVREPDGRFRHGLLGGSAVSPCQRPGADRGHQRRVKDPPQDSHSKPKTPRAGRRRFGGLAVQDFRTSSAPRGAEVRGSVATPVSRAPSWGEGLGRTIWNTGAPISGLPEIGYPHLPDRLKPIWLRRRKNTGDDAWLFENLCQARANESFASRSVNSLPSPLVGEGVRAEAKPSEGR